MTKDIGNDRSYWMRSVQFAGLHRILHLLSEYPTGLRARDLNRVILEKKAYLTNTSNPPSPTTLYHCRNTLVKLNAVISEGKLLCINHSNENVQALLDEQYPDSIVLSRTSRKAFSNLVFGNFDCQNTFFCFFCTGSSIQDVCAFRSYGESVTWKWNHRSNISPEVVLGSRHGEAYLSSRSQVSSIIYGIRYWALNELHLIDEYFNVRKGSVMFPIKDEEETYDTDSIIKRILSLVEKDNTWTTLSVIELIQGLCEDMRRPLICLYKALDILTKTFPGHIVLIPTSLGFATITTPSDLPSTRKHEIGRSYYRDSDGRLISHIRVHYSLRRA